MRHARERGAAVFIVVLVIVMLTAIGMFAANSATVSTTASGHTRQMTQTRYLTEYAVSLVLSYLDPQSTPGAPSAGLDNVTFSRNALVAQGSPPQCSVNVPYCFVFMPETFKNMAAEDLIAQSVPGTPGSLGPADIGWAFKIEVTDKTSPMTPVAGNDETSAGAVNTKFCTVALNAKGVIWPNAAGAEDVAIASAGSQETLNAYITLPCTQ
jgi:hypothetical protein